MPDPTNSSFIPKREPAKKKRSVSTRRVYVFTLISYVLLFSALIAAGGVYFYKQMVDENLTKEITLLNNEISTFSEANMRRVLEFDGRLQQAQSRLDATISLPTMFSALEAATAQTVQVTALEIVRENEEKLVLTGTMLTSSFDSAIFQRQMYKDNETVSSVAVTEINASGIDDGQTTGQRELGFSVVLDVPLSDIPYSATRNLPQPQTILVPDVPNNAETNIEETDQAIEEGEAANENDL